eukprot:Gb_41076 [translate_table: standard]
MVFGDHSSLASSVKFFYGVYFGGICVPCAVCEALQPCEVSDKQSEIRINGFDIPLTGEYVSPVSPALTRVFHFRLLGFFFFIYLYIY